MPDEETQRVEFDWNTVTVDEAIALEDAYGKTWGDFVADVQKGSMTAARAVVWLAKRRTNPDLSVEDVHFDVVRLAQELGAPEPGEESSAPLPEVSTSSSTRSRSSSTKSMGSNRGTSKG